MSPFHWFGPRERCVTQNKYYFNIDEMKLPCGYGILILLLHKFHQEEIMLPTPFYLKFLRVSQNYQLNKQHQTRKEFLKKQLVGTT